jgi:hypothetical protein
MMTTTVGSTVAAELCIGQLLYSSFYKQGFKLITSPLPTILGKVFVEQIVNRHWNPYNPPKPEERFAYLLQLDKHHTLFGWLLNGGEDELARGNVPYFLSYHLQGSLSVVRLDTLFACLHKGPIALPGRRLPQTLQALPISTFRSYRSAAPGVAVSTAMQLHAQDCLQRGRAIHLFYGMTL